MIRTAKRLSEIEPFRVMRLLARANELAAAGNDVIFLGVGEPDFETPRPIIEAAHRALNDGHTKYTETQGIPELRGAISHHYASRFGAEVSPERIFVTAGASGGLLLLTALLMNPGDNLLMTDPGYPCNRHFLTSFSAEGRLVPVTEKEQFQLTPELLDEYWTASTRGALVATPANPSGTALSREDLAALDECVGKHDGVFIVDEIYQGLVYEEGLSLTALEVAPEACVINSFSKYFGMTGWRLGWVVVPEYLVDDLERLATNLFICPSSIAQRAALAAFEPEALQVMESNRQEFARRRDFLVPRLLDLGFEIPARPVGAFYIYARLPDKVADAEVFCHELLETRHVAITPGCDFGFNRADRFVRISYARDIANLDEALRRMETLLS